MKDLPHIDLDKVRAELCRRRFFEFFKVFWPEIVPDELVINGHLEYICNELQSVVERVERREESLYDLLINVPPGSSKTTVATILLPAWAWVRDASLRIISGSYSQSLSTSHAVKSRDVLKSDKFQRYYGHLFEFKHDQDNKTDYQNTKGGDRVATSVGGTITGKHAHLLIVDDPINPKKAASETERNNANEWLDKTLSTRKVDKKVTATILIMQRLHENDCSGHWLKKDNKRLKHICLPAELSDNVSPIEAIGLYKDGLLDPVRMDRATLANQKVDLGSEAYAGQFSQMPSPEEGSIIKKAWFKKITFQEFSNIQGKKVVDFFADTAYTAEQKNDPTGLLATVYIAPNLYILDREAVLKELPDLLKYVPSFAAKNRYTSESRIMVEPKASGKSVVQSLKAWTAMNVMELPPPVDDKPTRAASIAAYLEAGRCFLIEAAWNEAFLQQVGAFPRGEHDEDVDNLVNAVNYYTVKKYTGKYTIL
jgi:predicted phage terminase large subunit-like protein